MKALSQKPQACAGFATMLTAMIEKVLHFEKLFDFSDNYFYPTKLLFQLWSLWD